MKSNNYMKFMGMLIISFLIMYAVMFLNVDRLDHVYLSTTRAYMALLMVSPMAILMLLMMSMMYENKKLNALITIVSVAVFVLALTFLRSQTFINDEQYMKAMIPHHSSAIQVSQHAKLSDPDVKKLADQIIQSQEREIAEMKQHLKRLKNH
ncbi:DUF305 domain-containing protein [Pedobacter sp. P351]|uniref:DUF305 domain-containing protein n=1 Tax=Pedobacter superstes TaxID=3133441 RepID=UPI00309A362D